MPLDAQAGERYDHFVATPATTEQMQPRSEDAERERVVALIEQGLEDVKAGRVVPHAEVLAMIDARYPGSTK